MIASLRRGRSPPPPSRRRSRSPPPARGSGAAGERPAERDRDKKRSESASPERPRQPEYAVRVPGFSVRTFERDYPELVRRYAKMPIPSDFSLALMHWVNQPSPSEPRLDSLGVCTVPLDKHARVEHELAMMQQSPAEAAAPAVPAHRSSSASASSTSAVGEKQVVKVVLLQGLSQAERDALAKGPHKEGGAHMVHSLKFVTARIIKDGRSGVLGALGGAVDPQLDGPPAEAGAQAEGAPAEAAG